MIGLHFAPPYGNPPVATPGLTFVMSGNAKKFDFLFTYIIPSFGKTKIGHAWEHGELQHL